MSTVNERAVRRIGKQRVERQWAAVARNSSAILMPTGADLQVNPASGVISLPESGGLWWPGPVADRVDLEAWGDPIVDRRKAESKTARPWWWFW
ncbi:hypothetical protein DK926_18810 [Rhodococcus sp. Eu-32]|uniref:hypothetical protein n=1 Tax=Rhodococcus sp. Eu-32 TaxID=1017319 RepID=UPI000DF2BA8A|nr:hypothetical protein [Rhodococcus sp. Eu-32]RRQ26299.1 hypothetical protein DK926_18810 [Rhodococcus sp. Eu-32]